MVEGMVDQAMKLYEARLLRYASPSRIIEEN
jgi:hypothetical protein